MICPVSAGKLMRVLYRQICRFLTNLPIRYRSWKAQYKTYSLPVVYILWCKQRLLGNGSLTQFQANWRIDTTIRKRCFLYGLARNYTRRTIPEDYRLTDYWRWLLDLIAVQLLDRDLSSSWVYCEFTSDKCYCGWGTGTFRGSKGRKKSAVGDQYQKTCKVTANREDCVL
jgi:hypothetical protein